MLVKIKEILSTVLFFGIITVPVFGQNKDLPKSEKISLTAEQTKFLQKYEESTKQWLEELKTPGVNIDGNQMTFNKEAQRLINYPVYRNKVYKDFFTYDDVKLSLSNNEYIKAVWQLITIYPENKEHILQYIYAYDKVIPSDELTINAFYTYAFFDPKITTIENGKPNIYRPDLFENYLRRTKEIVSYISYFRKQEVKTDN